VHCEQCFLVEGNHSVMKRAESAGGAGVSSKLTVEEMVHKLNGIAARREASRKRKADTALRVAICRWSFPDTQDLLFPLAASMIEEQCAAAKECSVAALSKHQWRVEDNESKRTVQQIANRFAVFLLIFTIFCSV
jgi:hypothetical protein